jgi:propionate CoA-transferase
VEKILDRKSYAYVILFMKIDTHRIFRAINAEALVEMNQQFDFYDGGGLDMSFLGAAQISPEGDVNVSRLCEGKLIGPGGFIDISQSTRNISFLSTFTAKGLKLLCDGEQGSIKIENEGSTRKFVNEVYECTFSGNEAVRRGQKVYYVTERAVFRRTAAHSKIELVEIAPGIDLQIDVLDQMVNIVDGATICLSF